MCLKRGVSLILGHGVVRQHHSVDRYVLRKSTASNRQQKSMEKEDILVLESDF